jgi:hypothetical protein
MHMRRLVLGSIHFAQFVHHNAKLIAVLSWKYKTGLFMRMRRLVLGSNHVAQFGYHNAKLVTILS